MHWLFSQLNGPSDNTATEADIISSVRFNHDGSLLATGYKGGKVTIFKRNSLEEEKPSKAIKSTKACPPSSKRPPQYDVCCSFQSHLPVFDYLKSVDIEEKINCIRWLHKFNAADFLLSTNDKTIKLWKIYEKTQKLSSKSDTLISTAPTNIAPTSSSSTPFLSLPTLEASPPQVTSSPRRVYSNGHTYNIHSLAINSDQETFLSADELSINLWHYQVSNQCFNIVNIKPAVMEDLTELISSADLHPSDCSLLTYSTSTGLIRLCDMRSNALCDRHCKTFEERSDATSRNFFSDIISSISHVCFSPSGSLLVSRDYFSVKVWDIRMEKGPLERHPTHEHLRSRLCALYEEHYVFDRFEAACGGLHDRHIMTGSYNGFLRLYDRETSKDVTLQCTPSLEPLQPLRPRKIVPAGRKARRDEVTVDSIDLNLKVLHGDWHPSEALLAVASLAHLYLLAAKPV